ncbi:MAG: branched-chain amino acid ABC transporter permease [Nitriliruptorales bacterium]|nr:branched-chain amino acid ABC transporter permease [Nitriliruptorales bacterium]
MTTFVLLTITGLGLAGLYFLVASGLSMIFGLMDVLNFAHGVFLTVGAYMSWWIAERLTFIGSGTLRFVVAVAFGTLVGAAVAALVELVFIRRLYGNHVGQILVTVGLALAGTALIRAIWTPDARTFPSPTWMGETTSVLGAAIPNSRFVAIGTAVALYVGLRLFLRHTRYGLVVRAGVENRPMVTALGINVTQAFTLVFAIGGIAAALGGALTGAYFGVIDPEMGGRLLIFAFIVVIIGGLGSLRGAAIAAVLVGLLQQYANFYALDFGLSGLGDLIVVLLLAVVLLVRPQGLAGKAAV